MIHRTGQPHKDYADPIDPWAHYPVGDDDIRAIRYRRHVPGGVALSESPDSKKTGGPRWYIGEGRR